MKDDLRYRIAARELCERLNTNWDNYDYLEVSKDAEKRVPRILFGSHRDLKVANESVEYVQCFMLEQFVRKYTVIYQDMVFLFAIVVEVHFEDVCKFHLCVCAVTQQGTEKLWVEAL